jgi:DNA adenine methylase
MFNIENRSKPILKWVGGKSGILDQIIPFFPKHFNRYVSMFAGGMSDALALNQNIEAIVNDLNYELYNLYSIVRDFPQSLMSQLDLMARQYSEEYFYKVRENDFNKEKLVESAARTIFLNKTDFNGLYRVNKNGKFNAPFGKRKKCPALYDRENLLEVSKRLKNIKLYCLDFSDAFKMVKFGDFVYCDPPYYPLNETSSFTSYTADGFDETLQDRLKQNCEDAVKLGVKVIISNSNSNFIKNLYSNTNIWDIHEIQAKRSINSKGDKRGEIAELLIVSK